MKVYAYVRVSTEMQNYASQEYEIRNYCRKQEYEVYEWIAESISGTVPVEKRGSCGEKDGGRQAGKTAGKLAEKGCIL